MTLIDNLEQISFLGCALAVLSCSPESDRANSVARDSAGITIVMNARPDVSGQVWALSSAPVVQIGVVEGDSAYQLYRVRDVARLTDGRLAVANGGSREIRYYSAEGQHLKSVGRSGRGPGEFMSTSGLIRLPADSLIVVDPMLQRCTLLDPHGSVVSSHTCATPVGAFSDGSTLRQAHAVPDMGRDGPVRDEVILIRLDRQGLDLDTIVRLPGDETVQVVQVDRSGGGVTAYPRPFALMRLTSVSGERLYTADGAVFEVRVLDMAGQLKRFIRLDRPPREVTAADESAYRDRFLERIPVGPYRARAERALADRAFPTYMPLFQRLLNDRSGNLWVQTYQVEASDASEWEVFDIAGTWICTVTMPSGLTITEIGPDYVLGVGKDDLEVEHVLMYELLKGRSTAR